MRHKAETSSFSRDVLKLLTGSGVGLLVAYFGSLVLLRLYPPEAFGAYEVIIGIVAVVTPLASLRYEDALMLPGESSSGANALILSTGLLIAFCIGLLLLILSVPLVIPVSENAIVRWAWTIPVALFANRIVKISELWLAREEEFTRIARGQVIHNSTMTGTRIVASFPLPNAGGLLLGFVLGHLTTLMSYARRLKDSLRTTVTGHIDWHVIWHTATRYRHFAMFTTPAAMLGTLSSKLPVFLLLFLFDSSVVGHFGRGFAVLFVPLSFFSASVAQVFFVRAAGAHRSGELGGLSDFVHSRLVTLFVLPTIVLMFSGAELFQFLFGEEWMDAGKYLLYLGPWILASAIASPLTRLFDVLERQAFELVTTVGILVVIGAAVLIGGFSGGPDRTLIFLGAAGAICRFGQIGLLLRLARVRWVNIFRPYGMQLLMAAPAALLIIYVRGSFGPVLVFVVALLIGAVHAGWILRAELNCEGRD